MIDLNSKDIVFFVFAYIFKMYIWKVKKQMRNKDNGMRCQKIFFPIYHKFISLNNKVIHQDRNSWRQQRNAMTYFCSCKLLWHDKSKLLVFCLFQLPSDDAFGILNMAYDLSSKDGLLNFSRAMISSWSDKDGIWGE